MRDAAEPILAIEGLSISYDTRRGEVPAVIDFNLEVRRGEAVGIVGESGCGKSTVAYAIMRYLGRNGRIVAGSIRFKGSELTTMGEEQLRALRGRAMAMVYQEPMASLNPSMRIGAQLAEVPRIHAGLDRHAAAARALEMLAAVRLPDPQRLLRCYPHQLSGGQQQRVVIAMALLADPALLILDEPTTALDVTVEAGIVELVREIGRRFGTAIVYISHNLGLIRETCDRLAVMYSGERVEAGTVPEVFERMRHPYTFGLFRSLPMPGFDKTTRPLAPIPGQLPLPHERPRGCNFGPRCAWFLPGRCDAGPVRMQAVADEPGHIVRCVRHAEIALVDAPCEVASDRAAQGAPVLEVEGLQKHYELIDRSLAALIGGRGVRSIRANERIDLVAHQGETVAIVGESGCGKSTFARVLMGLEPATAGRARFDGVDLARLPVQRRPPQTIGRMQMIFQNPFDTLNPSHSVGAQIGRAVRRLGGERRRERVRARVLELLDRVALPREFYHRRPRQLSGGQKQRVGIARAFAATPQLVIADEPVSALDVSVQAAVTKLLTEIQRAERTTLLFISHDLALVRYLADRVIVMYLGHVVEQGPVAAVFAPPFHPYTEALLSAAPVADTRIEKKRIVLEGELPSAIDPPAGCPFHTRCHRKLGTICEREPPPLREFPGGHRLACHIAADELAAGEPVIAWADPALAPPLTENHVQHSKTRV